MQKSTLGRPTLISSDPFAKTACVYNPSIGKVETVNLGPGPAGFMVGALSTGETITSTLVCDLAGGDGSAEEAPMELDEAAYPQEEPLEPDDAAYPQEVPVVDGPQAGQPAVIDPPPVVEVLSDDEEDVGDDSASSGSCNPITPAYSFSTAYPRTPVLGGVFQTALRPAPSTPMDIDGDGDELAEATPAEPDEVQVLQSRLLGVIQDLTKTVPAYRLKKKTPMALVRTKLVYKPGCCPVIKQEPKEEEVKEAVQHGRKLGNYRLMYYKRHHTLAVRRVRAPKTQLGQAKIPAGLSVGASMDMAEGVISKLEADVTWEPYTGDLLKMYLSK